MPTGWAIFSTIFGGICVCFSLAPCFGLIVALSNKSGRKRTAASDAGVPRESMEVPAATALKLSPTSYRVDSSTA